MFRVPWWLLVIVVAVRSEPITGVPENVPTNSTTNSTVQPETSKIYGGFNYKKLRIVKCYSCTDCDRVSYNTTVKTCSYSYDYSKMHKCVTYVEKYKYLGKPWYIRGCASERGTCSDIRRAHGRNNDIVTLTECVECEGERCNGVSRSLPHMLTTFFILVVTPILAKYAIS